MKLPKRKATILSVILGIVLITSQAMATDVGGIIDIDTTWDLAGSPYNLTENVQTDNDVILSIEPGVVVNGYGYNIELRGDLNAIGSETLNITFNDVELFESSSTLTVRIQFAAINGGQYYFSQNSSRFFLRDSKIQNTSWINIFDSSNLNDSYIERNIFINASGIRVGKSIGYVHIRNNVFYEQNDPLRVDGNQGEPAHVIIEYNSFLSTDRIALHADTNADINAENNFWNTTDTSIIDSMIFDRKDDLNILYFVDYMPFLTTSHIDTPIPDFNQSPTSDCGADKVVFDEATLDGSASFDSDGTIVSYDWILQHRTNPENNKSATGVNPTLTRLNNGFYDVCLTVTDNMGATDIDCSLLAASGSCFCTASTTHVESILTRTSKAKYGKVTVTIYDNCGNPVPAAEVTGTFSGDFSEAGTGVTDAKGMAVIYTTSEYKKPAYTFCVENVIRGTLKYEPAYNVETCDSK